MATTLPIIDKFNAIAGAIIAVISYILGPQWYLFAAFLVLNVIDYVSGYINARKKGLLSSEKGTEGLLKKFGYWMIICVAFLMSWIFINLGDIIGVNLHVTTLLGWFTLASLIINEIRSILENLVAAEIPVPFILVKGLEAANKAFEKAEDMMDAAMGEDDSDGAG